MLQSLLPQASSTGAASTVAGLLAVAAPLVALALLAACLLLWKRTRDLEGQLEQARTEHNATRKRLSEIEELAAKHAASLTRALDDLDALQGSLDKTTAELERTVERAQGAEALLRETSSRLLEREGLLARALERASELDVRATSAEGRVAELEATVQRMVKETAARLAEAERVTTTLTRALEAANDKLSQELRQAEHERIQALMCEVGAGNVVVSAEMLTGHARRGRHKRRGTGTGTSAPSSSGSSSSSSEDETMATGSRHLPPPPPSYPASAPHASTHSGVSAAPSEFGVSQRRSGTFFEDLSADTPTRLMPNRSLQGGRDEDATVAVTLGTTKPAGVAPPMTRYETNATGGSKSTSAPPLKKVTG